MDEFERAVRQERKRQDERWGEQNHRPEMWLVILVKVIGEMAKNIFKASTFKDSKAMIGAEIIQCAAVLKVMFESGKRNGWL